MNVPFCNGTLGMRGYIGPYVSKNQCILHVSCLFTEMSVASCCILKYLSESVCPEGVDVSQHTCGGPKAAGRSQLSPSTTWGPGIKLLAGHWAWHQAHFPAERSRWP